MTNVTTMAQPRARTLERHPITVSHTDLKPVHSPSKIRRSTTITDIG